MLSPGFVAVPASLAQGPLLYLSGAGGDPYAVSFKQQIAAALQAKPDSCPVVPPPAPPAASPAVPPK